MSKGVEEGPQGDCQGNHEADEQPCEICLANIND